MSSPDLKHENPTFFDKPQNIKVMMICFYVLCFLLAAADVFIHRHELKLIDGNVVKMIEQWPSFYAVFGFVGCSLLVFGAKLMRLFLMRSEHFYDPPNESENDINDKNTKDNNA
jgi:hypothetical protein